MKRLILVVITILIFLPEFVLAQFHTSFQQRLDQIETIYSYGQPAGKECFVDGFCSEATITYTYNSEGMVIEKYNNSLSREKILYDYNSNHKLTKKTIGFYNDWTDRFFPEQESIYQYDLKDRQTLYESGKYSNGRYDPIVKTTKNYTTNDLLDELVYYSSFDTLSRSWNYINKIQHYYSSEDKLIKLVTKAQDAYDLQFYNKWKDEYSYNNDGKLTESVNYNWDRQTDEWLKAEKKMYNLDSAGNIIQLLSYRWNELDSNWEFNTRQIYTFDLDGNQLLSMWYHYDHAKLIWNPSHKIEFTYNADGYQTSVSSYFVWAEGTNEFINGNRRVYEYDEENRLLSSAFSNSTYDVWETTDRTTWTYDEVNTADLISPYRNKIATETVERLEMESMNVVEQSTYVYSPYFKTSEIRDPSLLIFPNPVVDYLSFGLESERSSVNVLVYDEIGRLVKVELLTNNKLLVSDLQKGVYFYSLMFDETQYSGKFIKW